MINKLLHNRAFTYSITSAALVMMIAILGTKVTGYIRQALYSQTFGDNLDIFYAANLIPEVIFNIIALGSINAVLIPVMTKAINKEGHDKASHIFSSIINFGIIVLTVASVIMFIFTPQLVTLVDADHLKIIQKFSDAQVEQLITLMRLLLVSPILLGISSVISAILQVKRYFLITQLAPLVYNLSGILALFTFAPFFGIYGLAYGVILGSVLHLIIQIPAFKTTGIHYYPKSFDITNKYTKNAAKLMIPRLVGLAGDQIVLIIQTVIALVYPLGSLYTFKNAMLLRDIPISLFGYTFAQAAFPSLSSSATDDDMTNFKKYFVRTFQQIVFLVLPFASFIFVMRLPIVRMVFGVGDGLVTWDKTKITALILFFMAFGIIWLALINLLVRAFYSLSDTVTPVVVSILGIIIEILLSLGLSNLFSYLPNTNLGSLIEILRNNNILEMLTTPMPSGNGAMAGIALATGIGSMIQVLILTTLLSKKIRLFKKDFFIPLGKKLISSILLGVSAYLTMQLLSKVMSTDKTINIFAILFASGLVSFGIYFYTEFLLKDEDFSLISKIYKRIKGVIMRNRKIINQIYKSFIISQEKNR